MKIEEAIKIHEEELPLYLSNPETKLMHAIKLGYEALKRVIEHRRYNLPSSAILLPGETED